MLATATALQAQQPSLIQALQTGTLQQRQSALEQILKIPPAERTERLWLALADKLASESRLLRQETEALDAAVAAGTAPIVADEKAEDEVSAEKICVHWPKRSASGTTLAPCLPSLTRQA